MHVEDSSECSSVSKRQNYFHHLRFVVLISGGMASGIMLFLRSSITIAMVSMVNHTQLFIHSHPNMTRNELDELVQNSRNEVGQFDWNNETQEKIITSYMITYMICQFPVTKLIQIIGLRWGISMSLVLCASFNALTPIFAQWGWYWVLVLRLAHGGVASGLMASMVSLTERWTPKGKAAGGYVLYQLIVHILSVGSPIFDGFLAAYHWKWVYYVPALITVAFCLFWVIIVSDWPEDSKIISQRELNIIVGQSDQDWNSEDGSPGKSRVGSMKLHIPFYHMFMLKEFYSHLFLWCMYWASSSIFWALLPAYVHRVFQLPIDLIGSLVTVAQLGALISMLWPNRVVDFLMERYKINLTDSRKITVAICVIVANFSLAWLAYCHSNFILMVNINRAFQMALDTLNTSIIMSQFGPYGLSGLVYSMLNSLSCPAGTVFCVLVGKFLDYTGDTLECWSWILVSGIIMNFLYLLVNTLFCHSKPIEMKYLQPKCDDIAKG